MNVYHLFFFLFRGVSNLSILVVIFDPFIDLSLYLKDFRFLSEIDVVAVC